MHQDNIKKTQFPVRKTEKVYEVYNYSEHTNKGLSRFELKSALEKEVNMHKRLMVKELQTLVV